MNSQIPKVTVIMPCYNAASVLEKSIVSILSQTMMDWELLAIDDGSTDNTFEVLSQYDDQRIMVYRQSNMGVSAARNKGIIHAKGKFVTFLDADDTWPQDFLHKMSTALENNNDAVLAYCGWQNIGLQGGPGEPFVPPEYETTVKVETLFRGCRWPIHAAIIRRDVLVQNSKFDTELKNAEDYLFWLEIASKGLIMRVPEVLAYYHFHGNQQASENKIRSARHHLKAQLKFLKNHPEFETSLGPTKKRQLLYGYLLQRGYESYWQRDLVTARSIFRITMLHGYGTLSDWRYMLPAILPLFLHQRLIRLFEKQNSTHHTVRKN